MALRYFPSVGRKKYWSNTHQITFNKNPLLPRKCRWGSCGKSSRYFQRIMRFRIDETWMSNWPFCSLGLSRFLTRGHNQRFFLLRNTYKYITLNADLFTRIQNCSSRGRQVGKSRKPYLKSFFATFGQPALQFGRREYSSRYLETRNPPQVQGNRLTFWWKTKQVGLKK